MSPAAWPLKRAVETVRAGGVIAYPTEAVFGLGCDPLEADAVERILDIKQRDAGKGLILIASRVEQLLPYMAPLPAGTRRTLEESWPGPVTWVVPAAAHVSPRITGGRPTLAVRVTAHPVAAALCEACGMALVSTSANRSGQAPARTGLMVRSQLGEAVDCIVPGSVGGLAKPTEIRDAVSGKVLRAG